MENLKFIKFSEVNFNDVFFDSLKNDYKQGFVDWFNKKSLNPEEMAYVLYNDDNTIDGFMYLKIENGSITDVTPTLANKKHLKIGTFKFNTKKTLRGQRFFKENIWPRFKRKSRWYLRHCIWKAWLSNKIISTIRFIRYGIKNSANGTENVLLREMNREHLTGDLLSDYPYINNRGNEKKYLLSIFPKFHTKLFPDSKLINESPDIITDVSHANSIRKIYICRMKNVTKIKHHDILVIYRTTDEKNRAFYRSVATSLCVVEDVRNINSFATEQEFIKYCARYSVFSEEELRDFYKTKRYPYIISFTYNLALPKRINRAKLISDVGLNGQNRWSVVELTDNQFNKIVELGEVDESIIVN